MSIECVSPPDGLSPAERWAEIATILARGLLRMRAGGSCVETQVESADIEKDKSQESRDQCLDVSGAQSVHG